MKKVIIRTPRVLAILFICFLSMFAMDVFGEPGWFLALLIHLIPSLLLTGITFLSWKNERLGGVLFILAGVVMAFFFHSLVIASPALVIGLLFVFSSYQK